MIAKTGRLRPVLLTLFGLLNLAPFVVMLVISFRSQGNVYRGLFEPILPILDNYVTVLTDPNIGNWYCNTFLTIVLTTILRLLVIVPAAYAFARMNFRFKGVLLVVFLAAYMIPAEATMVGRYLYFKSIHLLDSIWVLILPEVSEAFYLVLLIEFFKAVPRDYQEAAFMDGASHLQIIRRVYLPLSQEIVATTVLFGFIFLWNNFLDPYLFIKTTARQLITPALQYFSTRGGVNIPVQMAGACLAILPVTVLFIFTQRYFVEGLKSSGIKG